MRNLNSPAFWQEMRQHAENAISAAWIEARIRESIMEQAYIKYANHHQRSPGGLRARRRERQAREAQGYCRHGVYVGGCGIDWMCGACENGPHWASSHYSKSERVRLERLSAEWEARHA